MIVDLATLDQDQAITQISQLESQLFGPSAWSPNAIRQELNAPARAYWADIDPATTTGIPAIRGYAGTWFDGYDTQIMTIGVAPQNNTTASARHSSDRSSTRPTPTTPNASSLKCASTTRRHSPSTPTTDSRASACANATTSPKA